MTIKNLLTLFILVSLGGYNELTACTLDLNHCPSRSYNSSTALDFTAPTFQYYSNNNAGSNPKTIDSPFHSSSGGVNQNIVNLHFQLFNTIFSIQI